MVKIGIIGTGLMGLPMAQRLIGFGEGLVAYNRTRTKLVPLEEQGVIAAQSTAEVLATAQVAVLMLSDAAAIAQELFQPDVLLTGKTLIQMGTIAPEQSCALRDRVVAVGGEYLEAPVLGSIPEAKAGTLMVMVGAEPVQFERWRSLLQRFGPEPVLLGPVGHAATVKLSLNQLIGSLTTAFGLSLALIQRQGVDPQAFMHLLRQSALYAPTFDKKLQRLLERNYSSPNFPTKHLLKDMRLFEQTAQAAGLSTEMVRAVEAILQRAIASGLGDADYSALVEALVVEEC
jgi:3-hydroxyisobutyrate dehydrogenase